ncbi:MAG: methyltransferase domain-containing protein [candidate division KSB1 bacterium]|nr:methyltransferase domain-containing protein [candidate division KSB1 bacterium]
MEAGRSNIIDLNDFSLADNRLTRRGDEICYDGWDSGMTSYVQTWANYQRLAEERGLLVATIVEHFMPLTGKNVLDFGCGVGGTARCLATRGASVTAVDINPEPAKRLTHPGIRFVHAAQEKLYFLPQVYDVVVLQDVLEHLTQSEKILKQIRGSLLPDGVIFISTPNRYSILNLISDPHWQLPLVAMLPRRMVILLVQKIFRRDRRQREDWPALLSLPHLRRLLVGQGFRVRLVNQVAAEVLFQHPQAVVCRALHLQLVDWLQRHHCQAMVQRLVNDHYGIFNFIINPTWYVIGQRT